MSVALIGALATATAVAALSFAAYVRWTPAWHVPVAHPDRSELEDAQWVHGLGAWEAIRALVAVGATVVAVVFGLPFAVGLAGLIGPSIWIRLRAEAARDRARRSTGTIVRAAEAALRSGTSLPDALRRACDAAADEVAARPVRDALRAFELGSSLDVGLSAAAGSTRDERSRLTLGTLALGIAERLPRERLADLLAAIGERLAFEERLEDEVHARAAGARQQQRLLAALVPGLALYLAVTMPVLGTTLSSDLGRFVLIPVAVGLELSGIVLGRRVTRILP